MVHTGLFSWLKRDNRYFTMSDTSITESKYSTKESTMNYIRTPHNQVKIKMARISRYLSRKTVSRMRCWTGLKCFWSKLMNKLSTSSIIEDLKLSRTWWIRLMANIGWYLPSSKFRMFPSIITTLTSHCWSYNIGMSFMWSADKMRSMKILPTQQLLWCKKTQTWNQVSSRELVY